MKRLIQFFVFTPIAIVLVALSVANREAVTISLDPFNSQDPAITFAVPLYWIIFATLGVGIVLGGFVVWFKQGRFRKEARNQQYEAAVARNEMQKAKEQVSAMSKNLLPAQHNS